MNKIEIEKNVLQNNLSKFGWILFKAKILKVYPNGSSFGAVYNWWNPASYLLYPITLAILSLGLLLQGGLPDVQDEWKRNKMLGAVDVWFKKNPDKFKGWVVSV